MINVLGYRERAALGPLVGRALRMEPAERTEWLEDLRRDTPVVATLVERLLEEEPANRPPRGSR